MKTTTHATTSKFFVIGVFLNMLLATAEAAAPFTVGNILVTHANSLREYTLDGILVQSMAVPRPVTGTFDIWDVAYDRFGRAHVLSEGPTFSTTHYISTFDPQLNTWTHSSIPLGNITNGNDGDLSILGDNLFKVGMRINVTTFSVDTFNPGLFGGTSETSAGFDGLLYSISSGSPRFRVQRTDPSTLQNIGPAFELRDSAGTRVDGSGIAVTAAGVIYVAGFDGHIYRCTSSGACVNGIDTGVNDIRDINLRDDGTLVAAGRFGEIVVTNTAFSNLHVFDIGSSGNYATFVSNPIPEPTAITLAVILFGCLAAGRRNRK